MVRRATSPTKAGASQGLSVSHAVVYPGLLQCFPNKQLGMIKNTNEESDSPKFTFFLPKINSAHVTITDEMTLSA